MNHLIKDLVLLAADKDMEFTLRGLLARPQSVGMRGISFEVFVHPHRDPGCRSKSHELLRSQQNRFHRALVIFDREGCGSDAPREELETAVENALASSGWTDRSAAVAINPELEAWVWSDSPQVDVVLGWAGKSPDLRTWLRHQGWLDQDALKPQRPKEAMLAALRRVNKSVSAAIFEQLALKVSFARCIDPAFDKLLSNLRAWFPQKS